MEDPDDEDDEDYEDEFEPIRHTKSMAAPKKSKTLGRPITVDERIAGLDDTQRDLLDHFMVEAKALAQKILLEKSLRNKPFSDTVLREMGLDLPRNKDELLKIPGINADMVECYGKRFLRIIQKYREIYGHDLPPSKGQIASWRVVQEEDEDDEDDEDQVPVDPNHQNVIDLITDNEEEQVAPEVEEESNYSYGEEEELDDSVVEVSHFFKPAPIDPRVEEYNRRGSQLEAGRVAATSSKARSVPKLATKSLARGGRNQSSKKGGRAYRRSSSGGFNKSYSGVSKKGGSKKTTVRRGSGSFGGPKRTTGGGSRGGGGAAAGGGAGSSAWTGITAMPT
jgi:bloom syndrome protein